MKKIVLFFLMVLSFVFMTNLLTAQVEKATLQTNAEKAIFSNPLSFSQNAVKTDPLPPTDAVLYSQMTNLAPGISAQDFEAGYDAYDAQGADDFVVSGGGWNIAAIRWAGSYSEGGGPAASFNVRFYNDNSGMPGTLVTNGEFLNISYIESGGIFQAELPSALSLPDGTYWIDIQGQQDYAAAGQYYWTRIDDGGTPAGAIFHWQNPGLGFGGPATWSPATAIWSELYYGLSFELLDEVPQTPILAIDPTSSFAFGNVAIGNTVSQTFTLQNIGGGSISISDISLDASSDAAFTMTNLSTLPGSLPPDAISFDIEFTPTAYGVVNAIVNITEDLTDGITTIDISGKGVVPPANDDCANAIPITGPYPATVSGTTVDATADCLPEYSVWYTVDLPYDLNLVTVSFCPTSDVLGTDIYSMYGILGVDCSCAFYGNDTYDFYTCTGIAPYYEFWYIPGPVTATLPITIMDSFDSWEVDFEFIVDVQPYISLDLTVMMEGPYGGGGMMSTLLNSGGNIPLAQPYNPALPYYDNATPDWLYAGTESVAAIPSPDVVDWVYLQLRDATDAATATSGTIIAEAAGFLTNTGQVVDLDGSSRIAFGLLASDINKGLFAVIYHRNHLGVISNNALTMSGPSFVYDFSSGETQVFGGANGHKQLEPGVWGMVAADGNGNGLVQNTDETAVWKLDLGGSGYQGGDFNMNGLTQNTDETDVWKPNLGGGGQIPAKGVDNTFVNMNQGYESQIPD
ncbi:MAG: choice-of-anchor D domain-containing protein [Bacteroidetes bacterium]|nr:choice-of-anchor D domain-containing protein [Bacteroidota bacterium]